MHPNKSSPGGDLRHQPHDENRGNVGGTGVSPVQQSSNMPAQQTAAANVIRSQIDSLYSQANSGRTTRSTPVPERTQATPVDTNPYHRTHTPHPAPEAEQWKEYHSAWQNYYQKYSLISHPHR